MTSESVSRAYTDLWHYLDARRAGVTHAEFMAASTAGVDMRRYVAARLDGASHETAMERKS